MSRFIRFTLYIENTLKTHKNGQSLPVKLNQYERYRSWHTVSQWEQSNANSAGFITKQHVYKLADNFNVKRSQALAHFLKSSQKHWSQFFTRGKDNRVDRLHASLFNGSALKTAISRCSHSARWGSRPEKKTLSKKTWQRAAIPTGITWTAFTVRRTTPPQFPGKWSGKTAGMRKSA